MEKEQKGESDRKRVWTEGSEAGGRQACLQVAPWLADMERENGMELVPLPWSLCPASTCPDAYVLHAWVHPLPPRGLLCPLDATVCFLPHPAHTLFCISIFPWHLLPGRVFKLPMYCVCLCICLPHSLTPPHSSRARVLVLFTRASQVLRIRTDT